MSDQMAGERAAYSKAPAFTGPVVWSPSTGWTDDVSTVGYICKWCGGPSPLGVGYVDNTDGAAERSAGLDRCGCGHSVTAAPRGTDETGEE